MSDQNPYEALSPIAIEAAQPPMEVPGVQFPPTIAAPGNEANMAAQMPQGLGPLDPMKNIGGVQDVAAATNVLQQGVNAQQAAAQAAQPGTDSFALQQAAPQQTPAQLPTPDNSANQMLGTFNTQQRANAAIANATADKAAAEAVIYQKQIEEQEKQALKQQERIDKFETDFNDKSKYMENALTQLKQQDFSRPEINGKRFWENQTTGGKIAAYLAVALGGLGGALTGKGDNVGLDMVNKAIDRDIDEQKFNIERDLETRKMKSQNAMQQAQLGQNMLGDLIQKFGSVQAGESAKRAMSLQMVQNKLAAIASGTEASVVKERAKSLNAQLEQQKIATLQQLKAQQAQQFMQRQLATADLTQLTPLQLQQAGLSKETMDAVADTQARTINGFEGIAKDKEAASNFQKYVGELQPALGSINRINELKKSLNKFDLSSPARAAIETEVATLAGALRVPIVGTGPLTDAERVFLQGLVGNPNKILTLDSLQAARLSQIQKKLNDDINAVAKSYGLRPKTDNVKKFLTPVK
jgi:hypothetical protein